MRPIVLAFFVVFFEWVVLLFQGWVPAERAVFTVDRRDSFSHQEFVGQVTVVGLFDVLVDALGHLVVDDDVGYVQGGNQFLGGDINQAGAGHGAQKHLEAVRGHAD